MFKSRFKRTKRILYEYTFNKESGHAVHPQTKCLTIGNDSIGAKLRLWLICMNAESMVFVLVL